MNINDNDAPHFLPNGTEIDADVSIDELGFTKSDLKRILKHAKTLGFDVEESGGVYKGAMLEVYLAHSIHSMAPLELYGVVRRTFKIETTAAVCKALTEAREVADACIVDFHKLRQDVLHGLKTYGATFEMDAPKECPDYAGYWRDGVEEFYIGLEMPNQYSLYIGDGNAKMYGSLRTLLTAIKRKVKPDNQI